MGPLKRILPFLLPLVFACEKDQWDDCVTSTGAREQEERTVAPFHAVLLQDRVDLLLEERGTSIAVEGGAHLLAQVRTQVVDGVLRIHDDNRCRWVRSFKPRITVKVPVDQVALIELRGTGNVATTAPLRRSVFRIEQWNGQGSVRMELEVDTCFAGLHTGAGDVTWAGTCAVAYLYTADMGPIDAGGLRTREVYITNAGNGDVRCHADSILDVRIQHTGDIRYRGSPGVVRSTITGTGRLIAEGP